MKYLSTRGGVSGLSFSDTVFEGLAPDGGLILPEDIPEFEEKELNELSKLSYVELAFEVFKRFIDDIPYEDLFQLIKRAYESFRTPEVAPVVKKGDIYILELFHGPTWAFKDIALQFLGVLFEYLLQKTGRKINILGATSGDTGSAAIYGVKGKKNIKIFILHPHNRVSKVQELMMTTVQEENVENLAIEGTFDDCQAIVKSIFMDLEFKRKYRLTSVNSINWARVLAQIVYYIWAYFKVREEEKVEHIYFCVPTGNFGDIFAGYIARKMLKKKIPKLVLATNENDILYRFVTKGDYSVGSVKPTISPSMDIQIASNFERYLYYFYNEDAEKTKKAMEKFAKEKKLEFSSEEVKKVQEDFVSARVTEEETLETIKEFYEKTGYVVDPHTAVGIRAVNKCLSERPVVCLATAHPAKFPETVEKALGMPYELPLEIKRLFELPKRYQVLPANEEKVKDFISRQAL
ncbi:MAG: threonine synthase [Thermodesulfobacteria bacterium]|nr:threonine synthase [Thermodesulfobacteriota bacterium]